MDVQTMKAIIEALRTDHHGLRRVYKGGEMSRTEKSPLFSNRGLAKGLNDDVNYGKYLSMTQRMGEQPVSYEEWLAGR